MRHSDESYSCVIVMSHRWPKDDGVGVFERASAQIEEAALACHLEGTNAERLNSMTDKQGLSELF